MLIKDPDYAFSGEEAVWAEARQRERQHRNNDMALSLGYMDTPAMKEFIEYLSKADEEAEKPIETVGEDRVVYDTPLKALRALIRTHIQSTDGLQLSGRAAVGTLESTGRPHIDAISDLDRKALIKEATPKKAAIRKQIEVDMLGHDADNVTGDYSHTALQTLLRNYHDIEMDYRGIMAELGGERRHELGHSPLTSEGVTGNRSQWLKTKSDELQNARLDLANTIDAYLPAESELPSPQDQMAKLDPELKSAGLYGIQTVKSTPRSAGGTNWDKVDFSDPKQMEKLIKQGQITQEEIDNRLSLDRAGKASIAQYLQKFGNYFPQNAAFDPEQGMMKQGSAEEGSKQGEAFHEFMRITHWHPDKRQGRRNMYDLLDKVVKSSKSGTPSQGFYGLSTEAGRLLRTMSPALQSKVLDMIMGDDIEHNPINLMNPDAEGRSGIEQVIKEFADVEQEQISNARKRTAGRSSIDNLPSEGDEHPFKQVLSQFIHSLVAEAGTSTYGGSLDANDIKKQLLEESLYDDHYPYNLMGKQIPGLDDVEGLEDVELDWDKKRLGTVVTNRKAIRDEANKELMDYKSRTDAEQWSNRVLNDPQFSEQLENLLDREIALDTKWQRVHRGKNILDNRIIKLRSEIDKPTIEDNPARNEYRDSLKEVAVLMLEGRYDRDADGNIIPVEYTDADIEEIVNNKNFQQEHGGLIEDIPEKIVVPQEQKQERLRMYEQARLDGKYITGRGQGKLEDIPQEYHDDYAEISNEDDQIQIMHERNIQQGLREREDALNFANGQYHTEVGEASKPVIKRQRFNQLSKIIDHAIENNTTFSKAAANLNASGAWGYNFDENENMLEAKKVTLTPLEQKALNGFDDDSRILKTLSVGGDVAKVLHGVTDNIPENPTLDLIVGSEFSPSQIRAFLNKNETFKALKEQGFNIRINPQHQGKPVKQTHTVDIYNQDETRRKIEPHTQEYVTEPNVENYSEAVQDLLRDGDAGKELKIDEVIRENWNALSQADRESLITLQGTRPEYESRTTHGLPYHKVLKTKKGKPTEWELEETSKGKSAKLAKDIESGGFRRKIFSVGAILQDFKNYKFADPDASDEEKIDQLLEDGKIQESSPEMGYAGKRKEYGIDLTSDGQFYSDDILDIGTIMAKPSDDAPPEVKDNYRKQRAAILAWGKEVRSNLTSTVHPLDEAHGSRIHDALSAISTDRHGDVYKAMNARDQKTIRGTERIPHIFEKFDDELGRNQTYYKKRVVREGKLTNLEEDIPTHIPVKDENGNQVFDGMGEPVMRDNPDMWAIELDEESPQYKKENGKLIGIALDEDGNRKLGVLLERVEDKVGVKQSAWGVGNEVYEESGGIPDENKGVHAHIANIANTILSQRRSGDQQAARREALAKVKEGEMARRFQLATEKIKTQSGLADSVLKTFEDILTEWSGLEDVDEWQIPDDIRERINKELPQFQAEEEGTTNQENLDAFLINLHRQFKDWRTEELTELAESPLMADILEQFEEDAENQVQDYVNRINTEIDAANDPNLTEEQRNEKLAKLPAKRKFTGNWNRRPKWVRDHYEMLRTRLIEEESPQLLEEIDAVGKLDSMFSDKSRSRVPIGLTIKTPKQLEIGGGGTHLPANEAGGIDMSDLNEARIEAPPMNLQFPPSRFYTASSELRYADEQGEGGVSAPRAYWWFHDPKIAPIIQSLADQSGKSVTELVSGMFGDDKMTLGAMYDWIQNSGFVAKSNRLPEKLELNTDPIFEANLEQHPNKEVIQMFRTLIRDADAQATKQAQEQAVQARNKAAGDIDPDTLFDYQGRSISDILNDVDLQENLAELFLFKGVEAGGAGELEEAFRMLLSQGGDTPYIPPFKRDDKTGADVFRLDEEFDPDTGTPHIAELHRRLGEFLNNFELIPRQEMIGYGQSFSQGAHGFRLKDPEALDHLEGITGADLISKGNPVYHMAFEDAKAEKPVPPETKWELIGESPTGVRTYREVIPSQEGRPEIEVSEEARAADWLDAARKDLSADEQERIDRTAEAEQQLKDAEQRKDKDAAAPEVDLTRASLFSYLSSAFELYKQLGSIAQAQNIELPHMSHRDINEIVISKGDMQATLNNLQENPLNTPINGKELETPRTPKNVADQEVQITDFLQSGEQISLGQRAAIDSYLKDLQDIMQEFNLPSFLDYKDIQYGTGVTDILQKQPLVWADGNFKLYREDGSISNDTKKFLNKHYHSTRTTDDNVNLVLGDLMDLISGPDSDSVDENIPEDNTFTVSSEVKQQLYDLALIASQLPEDNPAQTLANLFQRDGDGNLTEQFNWDEMNNVLGAWVSNSGRLNMGGARSRDKQGNSGWKGFLDTNWETYFPNISRESLRYAKESGEGWESYSANLGDQDQFNFSDMPSLIAGIKKHIQSIIDGEDVSSESDVQPQILEDDDDMAIIDNLIQQLQDDENVDPAVIIGAIKATQNKDGEMKVLDQSDYEKIIAGREEKGFPPIDFTGFPDIENQVPEDHPARQVVAVKESEDSSSDVDRVDPEQEDVDPYNESISLLSDDQRAEFERLQANYRTTLNNYNKNVNEDGEPIKITAKTLAKHYKKLLTAHDDLQEFIYSEGEDPIIQMITDDNDLRYIAPSKDGMFIPFWLKPDDPDESVNGGDSKNQRAARPTLQISQMNALKKLYYGLDQSGDEVRAMMLHNPTPEQIEQFNMQQIFDPTANGLPLDKSGNTNELYLKPSDAFLQFEWGSGSKTEVGAAARQIVDELTALFTHDAEHPSYQEALADWNLSPEQVEGLLYTDDAGRIRMSDEIFNYIGRDFLQSDVDMIPNYGEGLEAISNRINEELAEIIKEDVPKTTIRNNKGDYVNKLEGTVINHPNQMTVKTANNPDGSPKYEKVLKTTGPESLLAHGNELSKRYYKILDILATPEIREQIAAAMDEDGEGSEWEMPTTNAEEWEFLKKILGDGVPGVPGIKELNKPSSTEGRSWGEQLDKIANYILTLQRTYEKLQEEFPDFELHKDFGGGALGTTGWTEHLEANVQPTLGATTNIITTGAYNHLRDSGIITDEMDDDFIKTSGGRLIPQSALDKGILPAEYFAENDKLTFGNVADKNIVKDHIMGYYKANPDGIDKEKQAAYVEKHAKTYKDHEIYNELFPPKVDSSQDNIVTPEGADEKVEPLSGEELEELVSRKWDPKAIEDMTPAEQRAAYDSGKGPPPPTPPPDTGEESYRDELIREIKRFKGGSPWDPGLLNEKDLYAIYQPLHEAYNRKLADGVEPEDINLNGERRKRTVASINTARKKLGMHELASETLDNMKDSDLDKEHAKIKDDEAKFDQEQTVKAANNSGLQNLTPEQMANENAIMQQFRRIMNHDETYHEHMTDESLQQLQQLAAETHQALTQVKGGDSQAASQQLMGDRDQYAENRQAIIAANEAGEEQQEVPPEYGSKEHLDAEFEKEQAIWEKHQAWANYLRDGNVPEEVKHQNTGANVFIHRGEDGIATSYTMDKQGSRMTIPARGIPGKSKGDLVFDNEEQQGGVIVRGGGYTDTPSEYADVSPQFAPLSKAPKVFGLPEDIEEAYNQLHNAMVDLKATTRKYNNISDNEHVDEEAMLSDFVHPELYDEFGNPLATDLEDDLTHRNAMLQQLAESKAILENAEGISDQTREVLLNTAGYDTAHAYEAMINDGHTPEGLPIDPTTGQEQVPPQYMDQSGTLRNRVYHRATKMWYDPELLDDLRNKGEGALATFMQQPYDAFNTRGLRLGEDGVLNATDENGNPSTDLYRLGVPAANYEGFFGEDGEPDLDHFNGVIITRTGVHKVGDTPDDIPTMDADGNLNHEPYTTDQVSQASLELAQQSSRTNNPDAYTDGEGNELNAVTVNADGHFDGGWKEWLDAGGRLGFLEAPGVRSIPGMRSLIDAMQGKPGERRGDFEGGQKVGLWSGPQTYAGRQMTFGPGSTKAGAGEAGQSRLEQVRAGTYPLDSKGPSIPKLRTMWDAAGSSWFKTTGKRLPGLSANAKFQQFLEGTDEETQNFNNFIELFTQRATEAGADPKEIQDFVQAEQTKRRLEGDPRAAAMNVGEGVPEYAQYDYRGGAAATIPEGSQVPPDQSMEQGQSAVQTLYDQYGQPIHRPVNPNQDIFDQSQV